MTRHVLKAQEITLENPFDISLDPATCRCAGSDSASSGPRIRIVQDHPDHAVIEFVCLCGRKTEIRCEYAAADATPAVQEPIS